MAEKRNSGNEMADSHRHEAGLSGLQALVERAGEKKRGPAPVEKWNPEH